MGHSQRLRLADVRAVLRLVGEIRELGDDPHRWRHHMLESLDGTIGAIFGMGGEFASGPGVMPYDVVTTEWPGERERDAWLDYVQNDGYRNDLCAATMMRLHGVRYTHVRRRWIEDHDWYRSEAFGMRRASGLGDFISSNVPLWRPGWCTSFHIYRGVSDPFFGERERRLVHLLHEELGRLWKRHAMESPEVGLPPRLRQTLAGLLSGKSEKQIAARLRISVHTLHDYVKMLHQVFRVHSSSELFARCSASGRRFVPRLSLEAVA